MHSSSYKEFWAGVRDVTPLVIGAVPFGILFGIISLTANLPWWATQAMSAFVFAGASQFVAVELIAAGVAFPLIVFTTFIVNLRHALYSASVASYIRELPTAWRALLAFGLTDESYATAMVHYRNANHDPRHKHWYFLGANLGLFVPWQIATAIGFLIGTALGDPMALGLDFILPIVFTAILVPQLASRSTWAAAIVAASVAILTAFLPNKLGMVLAIAAGLFAGLRTEEWNTRS